MNTHAEKEQGNKSKAAANNLPKRQTTGESVFQFSDTRPTAIAQRKLQEAIKNSPRAQQLEACQIMANNGSQVKQLRAYQVMANNFTSHVAQKKKHLDEKTLQSRIEPVKKNENSLGQTNYPKLQHANIQTIQLKKLSQNAEANRQRLLEKQKRKYLAKLKQQTAEKEFHSMVGTDAIDQYKFPFDNFGTEEPIDTAMDRLPIGMRNSPTLRNIVALPDSAHGQENERTEVKKGELQEALAGWHFANERSLSNVKSHSAQIDFAASDQHGTEVPFDPFMSPMSGEGKQSTEKDKNTWAQRDGKGSYYKHTHEKGGNKNTVGVWDQTYTNDEQRSDLRKKLKTTGADVNANVHELRVPIASAVAKEHIAAEEQISRQKKKKEYWKTIEKQFNKSQSKKPKDKRTSFEEVLIETSQRGEYWRSQIK